MSERTIAIQASGLCKDFGQRSVLRQVNLAIPPGECVSLRGANGAGKTTLLRCLASIVRPTCGEVRWFGEPATGRPGRRCLIGMVAHESRLYPQLTLRENLVFAARMCGVAAARLRTEELLDRMGLELHADQRPGQISRGMRQRLAVARALIHDPPILLLDEPFAGLDAEGSRWLLEGLLDLRRRGRTLCFSSHHDVGTLDLADEVFEMRSGRIHRVSEDFRLPHTNAAALPRAA